MSATTEPTTVAAPVETKVEPTTTEGQVSTAIVEETAATDPAVIAGELTAETTQEPAKTTEEEGVVNATEAAPAKTTLTKRRTIFNPFGKSSKKDESEETKKTSKGFGSLFSRSKVTHTHTHTFDVCYSYFFILFDRQRPRKLQLQRLNPFLLNYLKLNNSNPLKLTLK